MIYLVVKYVHITCVILSGAGFFLRGVMMLRDSRWLASPWARRLPDMIDSVLLASALTLAFLLEQYPFVHSWLTAKVLGLLAYIGLGILALKRGKTKGARGTAWLLAMGSYGYIVSVALSKNPAGFLATP